MEHALFALSALLLNMVLAGPRQWYEAIGLSRIVRMPVTLLRDAERKLNRDNRSLEERQWRGDLLACLILTGSLLVGWVLGWLSKHGFEFIELLVLTAALPVRPTWDRTSQISTSLQAGNSASAHKALEGTAWRHHAVLDNYSVARAGIETLAVSFSDKIVAPLFWYLCIGLPGLLACKSIVLLQETTLQTGSKHSTGGFGKTAQAMHYWLNFIPARIAAILWMAAAAFVPSCRWKDAAKKITASIGNKSPQVVALLSAASVLGITLGGPASIYTGEQWIGDGTPKTPPADVKRALFLFALLCLFLFILLGVFL
jgi:adenosylcobinamide-phosphate synthase